VAALPVFRRWVRVEPTGITVFMQSPTA
jgi:hypothetical protein